MAKGFPYFKFTATEWLTGDIVFEDFELQGIFINVCALYWHRDGKLTIEEIQKRLKTDRLAELTDRFFSVSDGFIAINFLDEQLLAANHISKQNSENGKLGGRPKAAKTLEKKPTANRPLTDRKAKKSKEEEEQEEELNNNIPIHPLLVWIKKTLPNVSKLKTQITEEQAKTLTEKYHKKLIQETLEAMENYSGVEKKYTSVYLTLLNWMKNREADYTLPVNWQSGRVELTPFQLTLLNEKESKWYKAQRERYKMEGGK